MELVLGPVDLGLATGGFASASRLRPAWVARTASRSRAWAFPGAIWTRAVSSCSSAAVSPLTGGQPGPQVLDRGRVEPVGGQVRGGRPETGDIVGCQGQVELGLPDRGVVGPSPQAGREPPGRGAEMADEDRVMGSPQPDPVIIVFGVIERELPDCDRDRRMIEHPELSQHAARVGGSAPGGSKHATQVVEPPLRPVELNQFALQFVGTGRPGIRQGLEQGRFGRRIPAHRDQVRRPETVRPGQNDGALGGTLAHAARASSRRPRCNSHSPSSRNTSPSLVHCSASRESRIRCLAIASDVHGFPGQRQLHVARTSRGT